MFFAKLRQYDIALLIAFIFLISLGLSALYSMSLGVEAGKVSFFDRQSIFYIVFLPLTLIVSFLHYNLFRSISAILYLFSIAALVGILFFGSTVRGTKGWIMIGTIGLQPVEAMKIGLILALATYFSAYTRQIHQLRHICISGIITAVPTALVLMQPDVGSAAILVCIWLAMILVSGISKKYLLVLVGIGVAIMLVAWFFFLHDYQKDRIVTFLQPSSDTKARGYNVRQAMIAIGSGQLFGKGLGSGSQSHLRFLPEAQTDFIFSVIAEEMGLFGVLLLLGAWAVLFTRIFSLMHRVRDDFSLFTLFGIAILFFAHVTINIGGNLGLLPLTGIVLPFLSYGGSALFMACIAFGIVQSIKIHTPTS